MAQAIALTPDGEIVLTSPPDTLEDLLEDLRRQARIALNLGCGGVLRPGMVNCDLYFQHPDIWPVDARTLEGWPAGEVDLIEAQQLLEHLTITEADAALKRWVEVLRPGGVLIVSTPDLEAILAYISGPAEFDPLCWREAMHWVYGSQDREGMEHKSGYTPAYLQRKLEQAGLEVFMLHCYRRGGPSILAIGRKRC
jgi:SAM-dependent methyltransferase